MAREPKKLNLKSKIEESKMEQKRVPKKLDLKSKENYISKEIKKDTTITKRAPKKLDLNSKIENEVSKVNTNIEISNKKVEKKTPKKLNLKSKLETQTPVILEEKLFIKEKEEKKQEEIKNVINILENEVVSKKEEDVKIAKAMEKEIITFPEEDKREIINNDSIDITKEDNIDVQPVEITLEEPTVEETVEPVIEDTSFNKSVIADVEEIPNNELEEYTKNNIEEINQMADEIKEKATDVKPVSLDNQTLALVQAMALSNLNNQPVKKRKIASSKDMIIEEAKGLNGLVSLEDDNLSNEMTANSHGLTDDEIKQMSFAEILEKLLLDENVTDVTFNGRDVFVQDNEKGRYLFSHLVKSETIENFVKDITNTLNKEFNVENPIIDCEIKDIYSQSKNKILRLNAVQSSISPYGTTMSIRITQPALRLSENDEKFAPKDVFKLLETMIKGNLNILISGRTGSGKTELQKFLIKNIRDAETIVLIEDTKDTDLKDLYPEKNITSWITNDKIKTPIDFDALIKASLRNNPDWIIISETRGSEAYSMIKSGLSGHKIITTLHSDSAETNVDRLIHMCKEKYDLDQLLLGQMITSVFDIGVHIDYDITKEGVVRYICEIIEYNGYDEAGVDATKIFEVALQPTKDEKGNFVYKRVYKYGKISEELFAKLAKKKVLTPEISKFIKEEYYGKEI